MAEFPVVELLLALATRCGFEFAATHVPGAPASPSRRAHGQHGSVFSDGSGLVLQLMDAAMADAGARGGRPARRRARRALVVPRHPHRHRRARVHGRPVRTRAALRADARAADGAPAGRSAPVLAPARQLVRADDAPVTHLSPPAWQSTLQQRRAATAAASSARSGGATSMHGTLRATRAPAPQSVLPWVARRTPEEQIEAQKRVARRIVHARESTMRLRAACDDAAWVAVRAPVVDRWCDADDQ
ncbi:hypothetical protein BC834DRAFT_56770 [Gloeopeniophorella convolvens]|nr:hypothetical protein BC834DRAFT_56770 [Gloeopeniophorella convolvens]